MMHAAEESAVRVGVVGAQFADPVLFAQWVGFRFRVALHARDLGAHDRLLCSEPFVVGLASVTVTACVPAYWDLRAAFETVLAESDVAVLMLAGAEGLLRLNVDPIREVARWGGPTVAAANDPYCDGAGHHDAPPEWLRLASPERVAAGLPPSWPVHVTRIGSFFPERARCEEGADAVLTDALRLAEER